MSSSRRLCRDRFAGRAVAVPAANASTVPDTAPRMHVIGRRFAALSLLATALGMTGLAQASGGPVGGQIVGGSGQIQQVGNTTTIRQNSQTLSLNWQSFDIAPNQTVNFLQPGSGSIAINRIFSSTPSEIFGHLNANGQVWLINPNGILFGQGAQVNVGGLVASTLDFDDSTLGSSDRRFSGNGKGSVINRGSLTAANGGYIALLGNQVSNQGVVTAQLGTVAMGGGSAVTLTFSGNQVVHLQVDRSTLNNLVENRQLIVADGGRVIMTAGAKDSLLASVVNNTGRVQAQTVQNHNGEITLLGGMTAGQVNVGGTLDASAPKGGDGGFIETSAANFNLASDAHLTAAAPHGKAGTWLVDPTDLTIDSTAANTISSTLNGGTNVNEQTTSSGASGVGTQSVGAGDINVTSGISWNNSAATLSLQAYNGINVNAAISGGNQGKVVMQAAGTSGGGITIASGASIQGGGGVTLTTATKFINNAGSTAVSTGTSAPWLIYSVNPSQDTTGGLTPNFIQYNAPSGATPAASGNGFLYSVAPTLTVSGLTGTVSKTYDGTTSATLANGNFIDTGLLNGDTIASAAGTYNQSDVGTGLTVTSPSSIAGFNIVNGSTPVYGYALSGASKTANIGQIMAAQLYATIIGDPTKVYDGTTTATLTSANYYITGLATGQSITVNQPSSVGYASADVNTNGGKVAVDASFTSTNFVAGSGTKLSNYILPTATSITSAALAQDATAGYGTITPAPVYLSGVQATNKTYDATSSDTLDTSNASIYGVVNGDNVQLSTNGATGSFASPNAGSGRNVTLSGFTLVDTADPAKLADYQLFEPTNLTADIYQKALTVTGVTASNKVYDGTTADTLNTSSAVLSGFVNAADQASTTLNTTSATGNFSQSDVGNGLAVSVSGLTVNNGNYTVTAPAGLTANITPAMLTISFNGSANKIYDGTSYGTLPTNDFTVTGMIGSQSVSVNQAPAGYTDVNGNPVSNATPGYNVSNPASSTNPYNVTATLQSSDLNFTNGAKAGNYIFNTIVNGTGYITPAPLTLIVTGNPTRTYDGATDTSATLSASNFTLSGLIAGQNITPTGPFTANYYDTATGGTNPNNPPPSSSYQGNAGTWGVVATLNNSNYMAGSGTLLSNYILPTTALGYGTITPAGLTGMLVTGATGSKVYDGTNTIAITGSSTTNPGSVPLGSAILVLGGVKSGDSGIALSGNLTGLFASPNVGSQPLSVSNLTAADFTCTGCSLNWQNNYTFPESITGTGSIIAKTLYITLNGVTKQYDGNTTVLPLSNSNFTVYGYVNNDTSGTKDSGWVGSEGATITPTASFTYGSPNVMRDGSGNVLSNQNSVTGTLTQNNYKPTGSTQLTNYNLVYNVNGFGTITPAPLYVTGVTAQNKIYDGGSGALIGIGNGQLAGLADVDETTAGAITLNIGNATASTADGIASGAAGTITPAGTKNGNGAWMFTASSPTVGGTFLNSNVGGWAVSTAISLGGSSAGNYTLETPTLAANITPRPLAVTGLTANNKTYDGGTAATFTFTTPTFSTASGTGAQSSGLLSQDAANVSLNQASGTGTFATANANTTPGGSYLSPNGQPISVTASGFTLNGSAAGNYSLIQPSGLSADIMQATITATLTGSITKVYDGTSSITIPVAGYSTSGWAVGQNAKITQTQSGYYGDPNSPQSNAGTYDVTANLVSSDWTPSAGTSLSNYVLPSQVVGNMIGTITPYVLNLSATRVYDATTNIYSSLSGNVTNADNANVFGTLTGLNGDQFTVTGTGATTSKNVGTYTSGAGTFALGSLALANAGSNAGTELASNYTLVGGADSYTVTKAPLNITGASVTAKVYDGTTSATVTGATLTTGNASGDVLTGDNVQVSNGNIAGTFNNKNAGTGKAVTINSGDITGTDAGNYALVQPAGLTGTINQRLITISGARAYDGTSTVTGNSGAVTWAAPGAVAGNANSGVVAGDTVKVNGGTGSLALADVGTYNSDGSGSGTFTATGLVLSNSNYAIATTGNQFQVTPYIINFTGSSTYTGNATVSISAGNFFNGSNAVSGTGSFATGIGSETLTLNGPYTLSNSGNAGTNVTAVNASSGAGLSFASGSGNASNYEIGKVTYTVNPYVLSFSGSRSYDGTTNVNGSDLRDATTGSGTLGTSTFTGLNGDTFTVSGTGSLSSANKGNYGGNASGTSSAPSGSTQIGVGGLTLLATGANAGTELASNYTFVGGNDSYDINAKLVTLSGTRVYDGLTDANGVKAGTTWVINGVASGDASNLSVAGTGSVSSPNVGTYSDNGSTGSNVFTSNVGSGGLSLSGSAAGNYTLETTGNTFTINPYVINLSGARAYDGTTGAAASLFTTGGMLAGVGGETLTLSGSGTVSSKNVGTYTGTSQFNLNTLTLGNGSGAASNYTLVGGTDTLTINKAVINLSGTRQYDGNTDAGASAFGPGGVINTGIGGETLTVTGAGTASGANVGNNYTVTPGTLALTNGSGSASNYTLVGGSDTLSITPYVITLNGTRQYDAGTDANASAFGSNGVINTGVGSETLTVTGAGSVTGQNVGSYTQTGTTFNLGSLALTSGSGQASNYQLSTSNTFAITPYILNLTGSRAYDSTTGANASLFVTGGTLAGVGGETLTLSGSGTVSSKNVGTYTGTSQFNLNTLTLGNGSGAASNYTLVGGTDTLTINQAVINLSGTRQYDGNTDAGASAFGPGGVINTGIGGETLTVTGAGTASGANVGNNYTVTPGTLALTNGSGAASNYTLTGGSDTLSITPYVITLNGTRQYDAGTDANASAFGSNGVINTGVGSETLTVTGAGSVTGQNVGSYTQTGTTFNLGSLALTSGSGQASNYQLGTSNTFAITPYILNLTGSRAYDSTTGANASLFVTGGTLAGVGGETLTLSGSGTVSSKNVGTYTGTSQFNLDTLTLGNGSGTASNYTLVGGTDTLTINPALINISGTRQYDGLVDANASAFGNNGVINTGIGGETLTVTGAGTVSGANVGTQSVASIGSLALNDNSGLASNYTLAGGNLAITPYVISLTGSRAYDGTAGANANLFGNSGVLNGVNGETLTLSGAGTVSSANASTTAYTGTGATTGSQNFNLNTLLLNNGSGSASNYTLIGGTDSLTINKAVIDISGTRVYDATATANASAFGNNGVINTGVGSETLTVTGAGTLAGADVGTQSIANTGSLALTDNSGLASNYTLGGGNLAITPYVISLTGSRAYDGTAGANANLFGNSGVLNGVNGETLTLSGAGTVSSANASTTAYTGTGATTGSQNFNLNTLQLNNGSGSASNYTLIGGTDSLTINKAVIDISGTRVYDATATANASAFGNNGVISTGIGGETLTVTGAGTLAGANVGTQSITTIGSLALNDSSGLASNYTLGGGNLAITPYVLSLTGTRTYDGTANIYSNGTSGSSFTPITGLNGDTFTLSGEGSTSGKDVNGRAAYTGTGSSTSTTQGFNLGTLALVGANAGNYTLVGGTDSYTLTPATLTVVGTTVSTKTYDGTTAATLSNAALSGVLNNDQVTLGNATSGTFATPNAATNIGVTAGTMTIGGSDSGDYTLVQPTGLTGTITPVVLNLIGTRVYDGMTDANANLFGSNGVISTGVNGETVDLSGSGVLTSKNVGSQRPFANLGSLVLGNGTGLASNYTLAGGSDWVSITPATLTVINTTTTNRIYDGTRIDALSGSTLSGVLGNDDVVLGNDSSGLFGDKNVGNGKAVSTAMTVSGADASNYILLQPIGLTANITPLSITVTATGTNRQYNDKTGDVVSLSTNGVLPGDQVSVADGSADFADPYVGNGKTVTVSGITASGADAGNYVIADPVTTTTANITSAGFDGTGVEGSWIAQLQGGLQPTAIATPYGSSEDDAVGVFTGNQQMKHKPVVRNRARADFRSGLSLQFQNGGVRLPADASP